MSFGSTVRSLRASQGKTLRQFCKEHGRDPSNWSKIERDVIPPPRNEETLAQWARDLGVKLGTDAWKDFMAEAEVSRGSIPGEVMQDRGLLVRLPSLFRALQVADLSDHQLNCLIENLRHGCISDLTSGGSATVCREVQGTHPEQREIFRQMEPAGKLDLAARLNQDSRALKAAGLRALHPDWPSERIDEEVRKAFLYAAD